MNAKPGALLTLLMLIGLSSCHSVSTSFSSPSTSSSTTPSASLSSSSDTEKIQVHAYVSSVADTAPILASGTYEGEDVDYVVTSQPVLFASKQKNPSLTVYQNVAAQFALRYDTEGFPQAGLFIKKSLAEDSSKKSDIENFLATFDADVSDLVDGATNAVSRMNAYSSDSDTQKARFGFTSAVLKNVQADNGLAFLTKGSSPSLEGFAKFKDPLGIEVSASQLSSYYSEDLPSTATAQDSLSFSVASPTGASSAAFARYASDTTNFVTGAPANIMAEFSKGTSDFLVFDSVNGLKLSAKNGNNYLLVRMVTFGNLYLVSTGKDEDGKLDSSDTIVSYGENLVPDLVFKAVYGE